MRRKLTEAEKILKFKTQLLAKLREYLTDGKERPAVVVECYRESVERLAREVES